MNRHQPSADPDCTVAREHSADPAATVDVTAPSADTADVFHRLAETTGASADTTHPPVISSDAPRVPGYRIVGEIAKGGMGRVYAAHHLALDREVAIKTLLPGANAERFVTESKITAKLPHPGIPPVHELGTLADGSPFLAMKLIRGQTLSELLKARTTPADDLPRFVQIFEQVAHAVGFAHSRGIIHRDLKPLNVMVGEFGEVQVMDWGLARDQASVGRQPPGSDLHQAADAPRSPDLTAAGAIMGTPGYMAPEQARGEMVDARADVFALGSLLAALLTGKPAFVGGTALETIRKAASADLADVLLRLDRCGAEADLIAVAKRCLAADFAARPADGRAVADEVRAYRAGVEARLRRAETERATAATRAAETRKRQRALTWAGGLLATVLLAGTAVSLWQMFRAIDAEGQASAKAKEASDNAITAQQNAEAAERNAQQARDERDAKDAALVAETAAKAAAVQSLDYSRKSNAVLTTVFEAIDPKKRFQTISDLRLALKVSLLIAVRNLEAAAIGDPLEVARAQTALGRSLYGLGESKHALPLLEGALRAREDRLGKAHADTVRSMNNLAHCYYESGQLDKALRLFTDALEVRGEGLGPTHPITLESTNGLASVYSAKGKADEAIRLRERLLVDVKGRLGATHPDTLTFLDNLAQDYMRVGKTDKALPLMEEALKGYQSVLGPDHPDTLTCLNNTAGGCYASGNPKRAIELLEEVVKLSTTRLGADHPDTLTSLNNLAMMYREVGDLEKAVPLSEKALRLRRVRLGADHPHTLSSINNLAVAYQDAGKPALAVPLCEEAYKGYRATLGADHPETLGSMTNLIEVYRSLGRGGDVAGVLKEFVADKRKRFQPGDLRLAGVLIQASVDLSKCEQFVTAEEMLRECLSLLEKAQPDSWGTFNTQSMIGGALLGQKKYADAEPLLVKGYEGMKAREKTIPPQGAIRVPEALDRLIELYTATGKPDEAKKYKELRAKYPAAKKEEK